MKWICNWLLATSLSVSQSSHKQTQFGPLILERSLPRGGALYRRHLPAGGVHLNAGGVCLQEVSAYWRCLLTGGVLLQDMSSYRKLSKYLLLCEKVLKLPYVSRLVPLHQWIKSNWQLLFIHWWRGSSLEMYESLSTFSRNNEYLLSFLIQQTLRNTVFLLFRLFLQELSSYRCPLTGGVFLQEVLLTEVSSYRRCLPTGGAPTGSILLLNRRCPPTVVVLQMEESTYRRCPPAGGVFLQGDVFLLEVSTYWRCPCTGGVHPQEGSSFEMSSYWRCLPTQGVCLRKVFTQKSET